MIVEFITGPDDFTVGSKIVLRDSHKDLFYHVYEVLSNINGDMSVSSYAMRNGQKRSATTCNYSTNDFKPFNQWHKIIEFMPYDPNQQGETSDDI